MNSIRSFLLRFLRKYSRPSNAVDANRWIIFCQMCIGFQPFRAILVNETYQRRRHVVVQLSWPGITITMLYICIIIVTALLVLCSSVFQVSSAALAISKIAKIQRGVILALDFFNTFTLFARLLWQRQNLLIVSQLMCKLEKNLANLGVDVQLHNRQAYERACFWAFCYATYVLLTLAYLLLAFNFLKLSWVSWLFVIVMLLLPRIHKMTAVYMFAFYQTELKIQFELLNELLLQKMNVERQLQVIRNGHIRRFVH